MPNQHRSTILVTSFDFFIFFTSIEEEGRKKEKHPTKLYEICYFFPSTSFLLLLLSSVENTATFAFLEPVVEVFFYIDKKREGGKE